MIWRSGFVCPVIVCTMVMCCYLFNFPYIFDTPQLHTYDTLQPRIYKAPELHIYDAPQLSPALHPNVSYKMYLVGRGRLGNLMYQVASGMAIARANGRFFVLDPKTNEQLMRAFSIPDGYYTVGAPPNGTLLLTEILYPGFESDKFFHLTQQDVHIGHFFESWKYFVNISDEIHSLFTFQKEHQEVAVSYLSQIKQELNQPSTVFIGIHIRHGDEADPHKYISGHRLPQTSFILKAMDYYRHKYQHVHFVVCSDSAVWCIQELQGVPNVNVSLHFDKSVDLAIILTCGTYGWWASWLAGGDVVYFDTPYGGKKEALNEVMRRDVFLPHWIPMGN